jgi:hypothetical protein
MHFDMIVAQYLCSYYYYWPMHWQLSLLNLNIEFQFEILKLKMYGEIQNYRIMKWAPYYFLMFTILTPGSCPSARVCTPRNVHAISCYEYLIRYCGNIFLKFFCMLQYFSLLLLKFGCGMILFDRCLCCQFTILVSFCAVRWYIVG